MTLPVGIESLDFSYTGQRLPAPFAPVLVGVVGSGNLEVLLEPDAPPHCRIHVQTSARGFGAIWSAVLADFHARHDLAGVRLTLHDMGATPAVVSLRLDQAVAALPTRTNANASGGQP